MRRGANRDLENLGSWRVALAASLLQIWSGYFSVAQAAENFTFHAGSALVAQAQSNQSPSSPFLLNIEKREFHGEADDQSNVNPNRLLRKQNARADVPPVAPPFKSGVDASGAKLNLRAEDWALPGAMLGVSDVDRKSPPLKGQVSAKVLANYDLELIVDESLSMRKRDCPGGTSRWEWCGLQMNDLSSKLAPFVPRGFTLTTFAGLHQVHQNATPQNVNELFANPFFTPGTRLSRPLTDRLQSYFDNRRPGSKPLLIVVITDGVPAPKREPYLVAQTLITATKIMKDPREVTVVFFQIGGTDGFGRAFLGEMDNNLVRSGARFDFVKTVSFEELQRHGLTTALVNTIKEHDQRTNLSSSRGPDN